MFKWNEKSEGSLTFWDITKNDGIGGPKEEPIPSDKEILKLDKIYSNGDLLVALCRVVSELVEIAEGNAKFAPAHIPDMTRWNLRNYEGKWVACLGEHDKNADCSFDHELTQFEIEALEKAGKLIHGSYV